MAKPLLNIHGIEEPYCDYYVAVKIAMDDGTIQTYVLENKTDYQFQKVMDSPHKMTVGYQHKGKRKSRRHRSQLW